MLFAFVGGELVVAVSIFVGLADMFIRRDEKTGGAAGAVEHDFVFFRVDQFDHEIDDVARGAELPGVAL